MTGLIIENARALGIPEKLAKDLDTVYRAGTLKIASRAARELKESTLERLSRSGLGTGALARSWKPTFLGTAAGVYSAGAFSREKYAEIHDTGGIVKPKTTKYLPVPLNRKAALAQRRTKGGSIRALDLGFVPGRGGKSPLLIRKRKRKGKNAGKLTRDDLMFVLKEQVRVKATRYILNAERQTEKIIAKITGDEIDLGIKRVSK